MTEREQPDLDHVRDALREHDERSEQEEPQPERDEQPDDQDADEE
jgi:hypothetical protein